jgi:RNA polymerase sigma-70 factor (ECF subfamily)
MKAKAAEGRMNPPEPMAGIAFSCVAIAWEAHEGELRSYLRHRLADADAADDVLQDLFVKAMRQGQGFCTLDNPRAWLFQVARNVLVDRARMSRPLEPLSDELAAPEPEGVAPVDGLAECLASCMSGLGPEDAEILRSCDLEGQTTRAFAASRDLTLAAAKSRLLRARQRLRAELTSRCQVRFDADGRVDSHARTNRPSGAPAS